MRIVGFLTALGIPLFLLGFCTTPDIVPIQAEQTWGEKVAAAAESIIDSDILYDPAYVKIPYPNGDVDPKTGVCTDVVIRTYRKLNIDLQKLVHEDMKDHFEEYPNNWGLNSTDSNIDHRRVPNLMTFFERKGKIKSKSLRAEDYKAGDIVAWDLGSGILHIGIVSNNSMNGGLKKKVIHNIGNGQIEEDVLFNWKIIGIYTVSYTHLTLPTKA